MEEQKGSGAIVVLVFSALIIAVVMHKNSQTENLFRSDAKAYVRDSIGPDELNNLRRQLAKTNRPTGGTLFFKPVVYEVRDCDNPCEEGECHGPINAVDRSSLDSIIISEVLK
tara:strand:+ start:359 stop:697 length:339 start_codon:yes stop_codon:yes gene_type:complete